MYVYIFTYVYTHTHICLLISGNFHKIFSFAAGFHIIISPSFETASNCDPTRWITWDKETKKNKSNLTTVPTAVGCFPFSCLAQTGEVRSLTAEKDNLRPVKGYGDR